MLSASVLRQLDLLEIASKRHFLGTKQGKLLSPKKGHGFEFSDYRDYQQGDNPRYIDWGLFARSDRLYVKTYHEEHNLSVLILVDASSSMRFPNKWNQVKDLAVGLSYISLKNQHSLHVSTIGGFHLRGGSVGETINRIDKSFNNLSESNIVDEIRAIKHSLSRVRFPGVCIFLSDFLFDLEKSEEILKVLRAKNLDITFIQTLGEEDFTVHDGEVVDSENQKEASISLTGDLINEYQDLLDEHSNKLRELCAKKGASFARYIKKNENEDSNLVKFLNSNLIQTGLLG